MILKDILVNALFFIPAVKRRRMARRPDYNPDDSVDRMAERVQEKAALLREIGPDSLAGQTIVELGPGGDFALEIALVGLGAARTICIDRDPYCLPKHPERVRALYRRIAAEHGLPPGPGDRAPWHPPLSPEQFEYLVGKGIEREDRVPAGSVDLMCSFAVLEHLRDLNRAFAAMARLLKPGGWMIHQVDLRDHTDFDRPLAFLTFSEWLWRAWRWNLSYMNRVRWGAYPPLLEANGLRLVDWRPTHRLSAEDLSSSVPRLARRFRRLSEDDLCTLGVVFAAQKR